MARAILVIDVQKVYTDPTSPLHCMGNAAAIDNINAIVTRGRAAGDLIVQVRHLHRADGSDAGRMFDFTGDATEIGFVEGTTEAEDDPRLALEPASLTIHKQRYSCFVGTGLDDALRARGVDTIVVTMPIPALGPSLGTAPSGKWMCRSLRWKTEGLIP